MDKRSTSGSQTRENFIINFYNPTTVDQNGARIQDPQGRTLEDILALPDDELEYNHDYIQYIFPLPERSPFNPRAPVIDAATREAFLSQPDLRAELRRAFTRMLRFYGFDMSGSNPSGDVGEAKIVPLHPISTFHARATRSWMKRFDHNHLRISRILRSLRILGLDEEAKSFYEALKAVDDEGVVGRRTWMYWERAAERPLHLPPEEDNEDAVGVEWLRAKA